MRPIPFTYTTCKPGKTAEWHYSSIQASHTEENGRCVNMVYHQRQLRKDGNGKKSGIFYPLCSKDTKKKKKKRALIPLFRTNQFFICVNYIQYRYQQCCKNVLGFFFWVCVLAVSFPSPGNVKQR